MKPEPLSDQDIELLTKTRHAASRHLDIASTPRDTLAVLRQAAEQQTTPAMAFPFWAKWAFATLVAGVVLLGTQQMHTPTTPSVSNTEVTLPTALDPGIDVAVWNIEIESLMSEVDASLDNLLNEDSELNSMANRLINQGENWL